MYSSAVPPCHLTPLLIEGLPADTRHPVAVGVRRNYLAYLGKPWACGPVSFDRLRAVGMQTCEPIADIRVLVPFRIEYAGSSAVGVDLVTKLEGSIGLDGVVDDVAYRRIAVSGDASKLR